MRGWWKDTGRLDDMLEANRLILETLDRRVEGELTDSQIEGRVVVEPGAVLERSTVRGPAVIGAGARLVDAYIGPYTAIGRHCTIESAEIEHSILLEGSSVKGLDGRMESSLLGRDVVIARGERQPRAYRFMVGDSSEIGILELRLGIRRAGAPADRRSGRRGCQRLRRRSARANHAPPPSTRSQPDQLEPSGSSFSSRSKEPSLPPRLSIMCTSVASRVHGTTGEPCSSWPWWLRMMCSTATASSAGKPGRSSISRRTR